LLYGAKDEEENEFVKDFFEPIGQIRELRKQAEGKHWRRVEGRKPIPQIVIYCTNLFFGILIYSTLDSPDAWKMVMRPGL